MKYGLAKLAAWLLPTLSLLLISLPYAALIFLAVMESAEPSAQMPFPWDDKSASALTASLSLSFVVAIASLGLAAGFSLFLAKTSSRSWCYAFLVAAVSSFCFSSLIHLIAWRSLPFVLTLPPFFSAAVVLTWKYFPLALFMMVLGLHALERGGIEVGSVFSSPRRAVVKLILPQVMGTMVFAGTVIFALVFAEAEVPPLVGLQVYAEEFMGQIALEPQVGVAVLASTPFALLSLLAAIVLLFADLSARGLAWSRSGLPPLMRYFRPANRSSLFGSTLMLAICWPWLALLHSGVTEILANQDWQALTTSLALGLVSLVVALCLAYPLAEAMHIQRRSRKWLLAWMIMLLCLPGSLLGLGMVALSQSPGLDLLNAGDTLLILAHGFRLAPFATLLLFGLKLLEPRWMREELRITGVSCLSELCFIRAPLDWPKWLLIGAVLLAVILSDLATTILVVAPGTETAILRLYNVMHYGAADRVAALTLSQAGLVTLIFAVSGSLLVRHISRA